MRQTGDYESVDLVVRGAIPPTALAAGVRAALRRVDASLPVVEFRTMEELVDHSVFARRFTVLLVAGFAAFGLLLSCLGLYAVISYSVSQRTQEIGIRMPTLLDWLRQRQGLSLLWGTALYLFGIVTTFRRWWRKPE